MRAIVLNRRIVKMLILLVVINPSLALSDANLAHRSRLADTSNREFAHELDPENNGHCLSLGALDIVFRTHKRSKEVLGGDGLQCSHSAADLNDIAIRARSRNIILLNYSRDPQDDVTAQLGHTGQMQSLKSRSHRHVEVKSAEHPVAGQ